MMRQLSLWTRFFLAAALSALMALSVLAAVIIAIEADRWTALDASWRELFKK